jgi:cytochrome b561
MNSGCPPCQQGFNSCHGPTEDIHGYLAYGLFALAGLHALAALWHRFVLQDGVLARIWPARG